MNKVQESVEKIKLLSYIIKLNLKKSKRTSKKVIEEYENWWKPYEGKELDKTIVYSNLLRMNEIGVFSVNNKMIKTIRKDYDEKYTNQFIEIMRNNFEKDEPIIELGSGVGSKLFVLAKNGFSNLKGFELTHQGVKIANDFAKKRNYSIEFEQLNIAESLPKKELENKVIFTYAVLEQLKNYMENIISNLISVNPKKVINFEVNYDDSSLLTKMYLNSVDYQNNLMLNLKKYQSKKKIKILFNKKLSIQFSPVNQLSSIIWEPVKN
ncbi:MAG: class I SAM-dependent methyltransferase [Candidatus Nitrosopumilus sp. bin_68KS]